MKKWKNLSAAVLAVGMLAVMGISAFAGAAAEDQAQAQVQPTGIKCTKCEAGELYLTDSVDTGWYTLEYVLCQHGYPNKMDGKEEKQITNIYTCTNCKISQPSKTKQTRLVHQHQIHPQEKDNFHEKMQRNHRRDCNGTFSAAEWTGYSVQA